VTAGVFTSYNGVPLSAGEHYLIEERSLREITVRQPLGADTHLTLELLPAWRPNSRIGARAYTASGQLIAMGPATVTAQGVSFGYRQRIEGQSVAYYKVAELYGAFLPLALKLQ
jgi:hypothetical protein